MHLWEHLWLVVKNERGVAAQQTLHRAVAHLQAVKRDVCSEGEWEQESMDDVLSEQVCPPAWLENRTEAEPKCIAASVEQ
eukprot:5687920-Pleurochrysis_carterae.AAC.2